MKKKLLLIGCGDHGVVCANTAKLLNYWDEISFLDDHKSNNYKGFNIIGKIKHLDKFIDSWENYFRFITTITYI